MSRDSDPATGRVSQGNRWSIALLIALVSSLVLAVLLALVLGISFSAMKGEPPLGGLAYALFGVPLFAVYALVAGVIAATVAVLVTSRANTPAPRRLVYVACFGVAFAACAAILFGESISRSPILVSVAVAAALLLGSAAGYIAQRLTFTAAH